MLLYRVSELKLMGIDAAGKLDDVVSVYEFALNSEATMEQYIDTICTMYQEIARIPVGKRSSFGNSLLAGFNTPVEIEDTERELLRAVAEQLEIDLPDNFFDLGNLLKDSLSSTIISGPHLKGSSEEKSKYWKIIRMGADIRIKCQGCGASILFPRSEFEKKLKKVVERASQEEA